jgi:DNA repair protein SbcC/Rad50
VRLISLRARNFKKLQLDSPIQFSNGITLISGLNESGKSSVLDAILFSLFARATRPPKARNKDLISYGADEGTVSLDFEVEDRDYRVTRKLHTAKPTGALLEELETGKPPRPLVNGQEKVNEEIVRLLGGITYQEIVSSTVVAQKELNKLIELNKDDRKRIVNAFLNLESFNSVITDLTEEKRDLEGTGSRTGKLPTEKEKLEMLKRELEQLQKNSEEKAKLLEENATHAEIAEVLQRRFQDEDRLYSDLRRHETLLKTRESLVLELSGKQKLRDDYLARSERLNNEIQRVRLNLSKYAVYDNLESLLSELADSLETAKAQFVELSAIERSRVGVEQEVRELGGKLTSADESRLRRRAASMAKPIKPYVLLTALTFAGAFAAIIVGFLLVGLALVMAGLIPAAITAVRLRAVTSIATNNSRLGDLRYLDSRRHELAGIQQERAQVKQRYRSTEQQLISLCDSVSKQNDLISFNSDLGSMEAARKVLETSTADRQTRSGLQMKLQTLNEESSKLPAQTTTNELEKEIKDLGRRVSEVVLPTQPGGIVFTPELLGETLTRRDEFARKLAIAQTSMKRNLERIAELDRYIKEHADVPAKAQSQVEAVRKLERQLQIVKRAVEGVQSTGESLRNRVRPSVQGYMSAILPALTSSKYKAAILDEDYNLQVWDPEAGEYKPKEVYSGGAEDQFLLAMRLAFALALLPEVKGQKPEFVFLDEPLGSSDEIRRSGIIDYLAQDLSKKFKQIFIISHVGGLEEHVQNIIALDDGVLSGVEST